MTTPAILGGAPAFSGGLPFARPAAPPLDEVIDRVRPSYEAGRLTNGPLVAELEERSADYLGVGHVVAVSSCTAGLMLVLQAIGVRGDAVILPSFTFSATAHAVAWNGGSPVFAECTPAGFQLDVEDARRRASDRVAAVVATHVFGAPCDVEAVTRLAVDLGAPVLFDAAHAFGARRGAAMVGGGGLAEVFSMSPTKLVVAGEGGLVATNDGGLAETLRHGRDYGNPGNYDTQFPGLNARLSELHAATALASFDGLDEHLVRRRAIADRYRTATAGTPGLRWQTIDASDLSTFKDVTVAIDAADFGLDRDLLRRALTAEGIDTRAYFWPPVHRQTAYAGWEGKPLPVTDEVAAGVVSLPVFRDLALNDVARIAAAIVEIHRHADRIAGIQGSRRTETD